MPDAGHYGLHSKNAGREWRPKGQPEPVRVHDFRIPELGRAVPYGVYDIAGNTRWVSVGIEHDTAQFSVNSIRPWWQTMWRERYRTARSLLSAADGGGSNGSQVRLWKRELHRLATEFGIEIKVHHLPPQGDRTRRFRGPAALLGRRFRGLWSNLYCPTTLGPGKFAFSVPSAIPLPAARHQPMEQDRASSVLVYQSELARHATGELPGHRRSDQCNDNQNQSDRALRTR